MARAALFAVLGVVLLTSGCWLAFPLGAALLAAAGAKMLGWRGLPSREIGEGAVELDARSAPALIEDLSALAARAKTPRPGLFMVESALPHAFALGRAPSRAAIVVHRGLLDLLSREERRGVLAHELAHIRNRDTLLLGTTAAIADAMSFLTRNRLRLPGPAGLIFSVLGFFLAAAAGLIHLAIGRRREFEADRLGAEICGNPLWLAAALAKMAEWERRERHEPDGSRNSATPRGFTGWRRLFSTHPDVERRIAALLRIANENAFRPSGEKHSSRKGWRPFRDGAASFAGPTFLGGRGVAR
jgi:heat shock protein HtpX